MPQTHLTPAEALGPWQVSLPFCGLLMGILIAVYVTYLLKYPNDTYFHKVLATLAFFMALAVHIDEYFIGWYYLIASRTDATLLNKTPKYQFYIFCTPVFEACFAHIFFARRAWKLSGKKKLMLPFLGLPIAFTFIEGIVLIVHAALGNRAVTNSARNPHDVAATQKMLSIWSWSAAGTDILIAATLSFLLIKSREGFSKGTDNLLVRLATLSVTTASITAIFAILEAILLATTLGKNNANLAAHNTLPYVYPISIIFTLNMRESLQADLHNNTGSYPELSNNRVNTARKANTTKVSEGITIDISTTTRVEHDTSEKEEYGMASLGREKTGPYYGAV